MVVKHRRFAAAVTFVEVVVATVVLVIAAMGALSYKFYAAKDAQIARAQIAATCTAQLLLEDWMSTGGSPNYDPASLGLGFSSASGIPGDFTTPEGMGNPLNQAVYAITIDELPMLVMLMQNDVAQDAGGTILRQLGVVVEFGTLAVDTTAGRLEGIPPVILTTYVRADTSGG
jgi:hypothetical protein